MPSTKEKRYTRIVIALSIVVPLLVAYLFGAKRVEGYDFSFLPPIYATINGLTAVLLVVALNAIKKGNRKTHETLMKLCIGLSAAFLVMYVLYHLTSETTKFGGEGAVKVIYLIILFSHIALSIAVLPFVLFTYLMALLGKFDKHKKLARITFPIWLYVAVSGVIVYLMISPYYGQH